MREEDLRKEARVLIKSLEEENSVIGTSAEYIGNFNSSYLECTTLLRKKTKSGAAQRIINIIKTETGRQPEIKIKDDFPYLSWHFFPNSH